MKSYVSTITFPIVTSSLQNLTSVFPQNTSTVVMWLLQPGGLVENGDDEKISLSNTYARQVLSPYPWVHRPRVYMENGILLEGMGSHVAPPSLWRMVKVGKGIIQCSPFKAGLKVFLFQFLSQILCEVAELPSGSKYDQKLS